MTSLVAVAAVVLLLLFIFKKSIFTLCVFAVVCFWSALIYSRWGAIICIVYNHARIQTVLSVGHLVLFV